MPLTQQPPLQGLCCESPHAVSHALVVRLHDSNCGHAPAPAQPHTPLRHASPLGLEVQSTHAPPDAPHSPGMVPATHWLVVQQPPLQAV
jgi:hypothetical protein